MSSPKSRTSKLCLRKELQNHMEKGMNTGRSGESEPINPSTTTSKEGKQRKCKLGWWKLICKELISQSKSNRGQLQFPVSVSIPLLKPIPQSLSIQSWSISHSHLLPRTGCSQRLSLDGQWVNGHHSGEEIETLAFLYYENTGGRRLSWPSKPASRPPSLPCTPKPHHGEEETGLRGPSSNLS